MRPEHYTPLSILVGSAFIATALYFALGPAPVHDAPASRPLAAERAAKRDRAPDDPFAERDRRRAFDDVPADDEPEQDAPLAEPPPEHVPAAPELAMASPLPVPAAHGLAAEVERGAREAFDDVRSEVRDECWNELPDDPDAPSSVELDLSLSYDAEGNVIASGISEDRAARRDGLSACLGPIVHGLRIPAPGRRASVQVRVTVP